MKKTRSYEVDNRNRPLTLSCGKANEQTKRCNREAYSIHIIMRSLSHCVEVTRCRLEAYPDQNPDQIAISEVLGLKQTQ